MKFRTQLIGATVVFALLLVFVTGFVISTNQHVDSLTRQEDIANGIAIQIGELGYLSDDFILYREPQQADQWNAKFQSISSDISRLSVDQPEQRVIANTLAANLRNIKSIFDDISSTPVQPGGQDIGAIEISLGRMALQNQGMIFDASRLAGLIRAEEIRVRVERLYFVFTLMGAFAAFLLTGYFLIYRRTLRSIADLQEGAAIIGSGDLSHEISIKGDNEIALLSQSFNKMTADLRRITASKVDLEREVAGRKEAEEQLIRKNEDLGAAYEEITATQEELRQNIDELTKREEDLSKALSEKEVLLSEIHHRVKNNLTAFISLLSLEGSIEETPAGKQLKLDLQNRARSMALVHETLYRTHLYNDVDMEMYFTTLLEQIAQSFQTKRAVKTVVDAHGVMLDIPRATPAGLIVNELVTNSFKYAFPDSFDSVATRNAPPTISISLTRINGMYEMVFRDNGIGVPPGFDLATTKSLGLKLVNFLAKHQMRAKVEVHSDNGMELVFRFKE